MRLLILILLMVVCTNGGVLDKAVAKIKSIFGSENGLRGELKRVLNETGALRVYEKMKKLNAKMKNLVKQTPTMLKSLKEKLKNLRHHRRDKIDEMGDSIAEINKNSGVSEYLYDGDMVLSESQAKDLLKNVEDQINRRNRVKRQAYRYPMSLWTDGVNYYFHKDASPSMRKAFVKATEIWQRNTCINFYHNENANDKIHVHPGDGCWSEIGRRTGTQSLSLGKGCERVGYALHEIGHALSFIHTMSRHDREAYVKVYLENIIKGEQKNYGIYSENRNHNYGMPYDYGSVMHYGMYGFTRNGQPVIVPNDLQYKETMGSHMLSFTDISMMNEHYGCKDRCKPETSAKCRAGGFPHPRNCSTCICPSGYGGRTCTQRPRGCGHTLQATSDWTQLEDYFGYGEQPMDDFRKCNYWILSPPNTQVEVRIVSFPKGLAVDGCHFAGVEVKIHKDRTLTGYRFCSPDDLYNSVKSYYNFVPIITYSRSMERPAKIKTVLEYRHVPWKQTPSSYK